MTRCLPLRCRSVCALAATLAAGACADGSPVEGLRTPGGVRYVIVSGDGQEGPAGAELPDPLVVRAVDDGGAPMAGQIVNWVVTQGGGRVFAGVSQTNANGYAQEWWTLGSDPGPNALEVRAIDNRTGQRLVFGTFGATGRSLLEHDFEGRVGGEWSTGRVAVTPAGARRFLGDFGNETVTLRLTGLPEHQALTLSFDLYVLRSMDGYHELYGPDVFEFSLDGQAFLTTTFAMYGEQAFPGQHPDARHPARTGASEFRTLGYLFNGSPLDAVFPVRVTVPHQGGTATIAFAARGLQDARDAEGNFRDESWGLDNVRVELGQ